MLMTLLGMKMNQGCFLEMHIHPVLITIMSHFRRIYLISDTNMKFRQ